MLLKVKQKGVDSCVYDRSPERERARTHAYTLSKMSGYKCGMWQCLLLDMNLYDQK